ncbi:SEL1-like repeat protein [Nocardia sp. KC 131]|uniref:SEL1-like repeat protein n=1 Tax=Nocardia arseniciresistens TaxID=3392119 RepID=UPI00398E9B22
MITLFSGNTFHGDFINGPGPGSPRPLHALVRWFGPGDLPTVAQVNPYLLGATSSAFGSAQREGHHDRYVARTRNRVDAGLAAALGGAQLVIVVGPSKAGKTRTLFEAIRTCDSAAKVLWPELGCVGELATHPRLATTDDLIVVWLDDLHDYLNAAEPLTPALLARLTARPGRTVVVATLRSEMRARLRGEGELQRDTLRLLDQALIIDLASTSEDPDEQAAAARTYPDMNFGGHGLGEILAGAPELLQRYDDAKAADPVQRTVIEVAIDWARIGRTDHIPEPTLTELVVDSIRVKRPEIDTTGAKVRAAIEAARTPPEGAGRAAALHTSYLDEQTRGYRAFDYLVAADDGQDHRTPRPIPETFWHTATHNADPDTLSAVASAAYQRDNTPAAITLFGKAAATDHPTAMYSLGRLLHDRGDLVEAESWYRKAADLDHPDAMVNRGFLLQGRGDLVEAESWYRKAVDLDHPVAMVNLAFLLHDRGDLVEAESWYRKAAATDHPDPAAMHNLGSLLQGRGDLVEAESWYRKAAATDLADPAVMYNLGFLLQGRGDLVEAESWYRKAADLDHPDAMYNLGSLLRGRGDLAEAESWYRKVADLDHPLAMVNLGNLLHDRGAVVEAESWYRKAAGDQ